MPTSTPYDWAREVKSELKQLDDIPLTGAAPPFPWEEFSSRLALSFERESLKIIPGEISWRSKEQLCEGLGDSPIPLNLSIPSLKGSACWVMPEQEMANLESLLLTKETHPITFQNRSLSEAFYKFVALEVLYHLTQLNVDKALTPILTSQVNLPNEDALCWNISIVIQGQSLWGRLIISQDLRRSWVEYFAQKEAPSSLSQEMAKKVDILLHLEVGRTLLSFQQWSKVKLGDWVALDRCFLSTEDLDQGHVLLTTHERNAFWGELQNGKIKILEFSTYQEVNIPMTIHDEEDEDDFDEFSETDDLDLDDETTFATDADFLDEEEEFEETKPPPPLASTEPAAPKKEEPKKVEPQAQATPPASAHVAKATSPTDRSKPIHPKEIPINIVIEMGRIQMTVETLMHLEPGNLLELDIHPENGLNLVVNGKIIGKGELIRLGDSLGIRVIEIG